VSGDANPVEFPSLRVQDRLRVHRIFSYQFCYVSGRLGIQECRVADVLGNEWDVTRSDGTRGERPVHPVEIRQR
jgi:hypothetical protein